MNKLNSKIAFGMIVFEGDYVLEASLESVYPYASQILIAEGPVKFWQDKGRVTSKDNTNSIIDNFPDPENKITIVHGQFSEKDEQCSAYMKYLRDDIDFVWNLDSDEVFKGEDIENLIKIMEDNNYTSADLKSCSFFGGFDRYIGGFEEKKGNFHRVFRVYPGSTWLTHRPPTIIHKKEYQNFPKKHIDGDTLWFKHNIRMYHYSYVFPNQVKNKIEYYEAKVSKENCFKNYYETIYRPWVTSSSEDEKFKIESINSGVHEFIKSARTHAYTKKFLGSHPDAINKRIEIYKERIISEIKKDNENQCWDNPNIHKHMLDGANGKIFVKLEHSDHWPSLKSLLDISRKSGSKNLCDLGCGAAALGEIYKDMEYVGSDLDHIIENVAQKFYPDGKYIKADIKTADLKFLNNFDCLVLNCLIDIMEDPVASLDNILNNARHQVIVHRQSIGSETKSWLIPSYGGMDAYRSQFSENDINNLLTSHGFKLIKLIHIQQLDQYSFLIEKNK